MCPPPVLLMLPTLRWMCPLCAGSRGDGGCHGFVFVRFMNRANADTVFGNVLFLKGLSGRVKARQRPETVFTTSTPCFWRVVWSAASGHCSNIYPALFFIYLVYSDLSVLPSHSLPLWMWVWFLFVADQQRVPDAALTVDESHLWS